VQRLVPEGDVCLGEEELFQQVREGWWRDEEGREEGGVGRCVTK